MCKNTFEWQRDTCTGVRMWQDGISSLLGIGLVVYRIYWVLDRCCNSSFRPKKAWKSQVEVFGILFLQLSTYMTSTLSFQVSIPSRSSQFFQYIDMHILRINKESPHHWRLNKQIPGANFQQSFRPWCFFVSICDPNFSGRHNLHLYHLLPFTPPLKNKPLSQW